MSDLRGGVSDFVLIITLLVVIFRLLYFYRTIIFINELGIIGWMLLNYSSLIFTVAA